jgi:error-prone DNA polymerase
MTVLTRYSLTPSWPGLSRPSTPFFVETPQDVDARHKAGHDE